MAGSMKDIKLRIRSVQSTMQITKAMELVASSKLRRAKERAEASRVYYQQVHQTLLEVAAHNTELTSPYAAARERRRSCVIVIAGDRGLAGGFNHNLFKAVAASGEVDCVLPIGKKALDFYRRRGTEILSEEYAEAEHITIRDCHDIARFVCEKYLEGSFDTLSIAYTNFVSMLSQMPAVVKALPMLELEQQENAQTDGRPRELTLYEPDSEAVFEQLIPHCIAGMLCGAVRESFASEQAARRMAMDSASKNAGEMIAQLDLSYNRARQSAITQEITEIVAGAEA